MDHYAYIRCLVEYNQYTSPCVLGSSVGHKILLLFIFCLAGFPKIHPPVHGLIYFIFYLVCHVIFMWVASSCNLVRRRLMHHAKRNRALATQAWYECYIWIVGFMIGMMFSIHTCHPPYWDVSVGHIPEIDTMTPLRHVQEHSSLGVLFDKVFFMSLPTG